MHRYKQFVLMLLAGIILNGCGSPPPKTARSGNWTMTLQAEGGQVALPLEVMHVYLTDNDNYPESFEMIGKEVYLVGEFPLSLRVDYGEDWENMINKEIKISARIRPDYAHLMQGPSNITLPGQPKRYISSGTLTVRKVTGKMSGLEGDITLSGDMTLNISTGGEPQRVSGTFSVHGVSLG